MSLRAYVSAGLTLRPCLPQVFAPAADTYPVGVALRKGLRPRGSILMLTGSQQPESFPRGLEPFSPSPGHSPRESVSSPREPHPFLCISSALRRLLMQSRMIAARTNIASIEGEPGTGKLLFAQNMHAQSSLAELPFCHADARAWLATDCDISSLSGILYLDRVDLLAHPGQNLLLSFVKMLQTAPPARFLLLTSSHASLRQLASRDLFLPDLAFRLSAVHFLLPPLRDHREDIAPLTQALIDRICSLYQQPTAVLAPGALPRLLQHDWPGNVRELASILESAILASPGIIRPGDLPIQTPSRSASVLSSLTSIPPAPPNASAHDQGDLSLDAAIHRHIVFVLQHHRGNKLRAARQLGISRSTLYRLLAGESAAL